MEKKQIAINYFQTNNIKNISDIERQLIEAAVKATAKSYAPYSEYNVGASILLDNGNIISGGNQENAVSPITICAEKVAVAAVKSEYPNAEIEAIAITAKSNKYRIATPVPPCGSCRQFLSEIQERQKKIFKVILHSEEGVIYIFNSIDDLLPIKFKL